MKIIDRLISFIFDILVIVLAVAILLVMVNVINYSTIDGLLKDYIFNFNYKTIIIPISVVVILLGLKITVFSSLLGTESKEKVFVDTPHGKIQINQETIEGIARNVIKDYEQVKDVQARMTKAKKGINMYMVIQVYENTNIKDIVTKVQNDVKSQIFNTTSIDVQNVDVKIKNVVKSSANKPVQIVKNDIISVESIPQIPDNNETSNNIAISEKPYEDKQEENDVLYQTNPNEEPIDTNQEDSVDNNTDTEEKNDNV